MLHGGGALLLAVAGAWSLQPIPSFRQPKPRAPLLLVTPPVERSEPAADPPVTRAPAPVAAPKLLYRPPPRIETARLPLEPLVAPELPPKPPQVPDARPQALVEPPLTPSPQPAVKTDVFARVPSASIAKPAATVRTGGFAAAGLPAPARPGGRMVARVGAFEAAGGESAAPRRAAAVASAGFSGPSGDAASPATRALGAVRSGGFGDAVVEPPAQSRSRQNAAKLASSSVKILFEPRPVYTAEARRLRIEGEVLLDLLFCASGEVRVLRIVKPLGHGLDEAAIEAAQKIRFQPAQVAGQPVDSNAEAHITFQLAY
ncbi:MAG TPA: TonB family protein [Bryobacterales bacterium]|nr:TonB family protein [Bryobacterales bacterium]